MHGSRDEKPKVVRRCRQGPYLLTVSGPVSNIGTILPDLSVRGLEPYPRARVQRIHLSDQGKDNATWISQVDRRWARSAFDFSTSRSGRPIGSTRSRRTSPDRLPGRRSSEIGACFWMEFKTSLPGGAHMKPQSHSKPAHTSTGTRHGVHNLPRQFRFRIRAGSRQGSPALRAALRDSRDDRGRGCAIALRAERGAAGGKLDNSASQNSAQGSMASSIQRFWPVLSHDPTVPPRR